MDKLFERAESLRRREGHALSAHSIPSIRLWQGPRRLELRLGGDYYTVRAEKSGENVWFFPCGSEEGKLRFLSEHASEPDLILRYLRAEDAAWLEARFPGKFSLLRRPGDDEYLYLRGRHVAMEGGRFRHLRQRLSKIQRELAPRTELLGEQNTTDARRVLDAWASAHPAWGADDRLVTLEALERREELGLHGVIVYLDGRPAAFMMGFPLTRDTFDAAVGKWAADVQGLTYYVLRELMLSLPESYEWFNLEEDLGLPGLREMKRHFLPDGKNELWEARRL
uniref:phosphatidylglycerol lysyltransferase domain-containing protein n=1 Tax=Candidatus Scatomorpha intestinigallinarum TaxID=2840923 RepID=UPI004025340D